MTYRADIIAPASIEPVTWKQIKEMNDATMKTHFESIFQSADILIDPDEWARNLAEAEDEFHAASAEALGMDRSSFESSAVDGRIQWSRADTAQLYPPCQIRIDGGPWHYLTRTI
jgi:hypothetical protein